MTPQAATEKVKMVVEGMFSTEAIYGLAQKVGVDMPIIEGIYRVINDQLTAHEAVKVLMEREKKREE